MSKAIIGIDKSRSYRVYLTITTDTIEEARTIHGTTPLATAGLGRVLTATGLMGIMMKNKSDKCTVIFSGDGPAKQILATSTGDGSVKGYISNPEVDLPLTKEGKLDVGGSLGTGNLTVTKDMGLKDPYTGTIALVSGEIAEDLTTYFFLSEQQNSSVALGVKVERDYSVGAAGGMIIQMLPNAQEGAVDALEKVIHKMKPITSSIEEVEQAFPGKTKTDMVTALMHHIFLDMPFAYQIETLQARDINWQCDCSRERLRRALMTIGTEELTQIIEEDGQAELQCQFCLKKYQFSKSALEEIRQAI